MRQRIPIDKIDPNPFRDFKINPLRPATLETLRHTIDAERGGTGFWDNLLLRPHPTKQGRFQLAYGHHRLAVLKELGFDAIESPARKLTDFEMLRIMADENLRDAMDIRTVFESVTTAQRHLQAMLDECDTVEGWRLYAAKFSSVSHKSFLRQKEQGVGRETLAALLGGNWKAHIEFALRAKNGCTPSQLRLVLKADTVWAAQEALHEIERVGLTDEQAAEAADTVDSMPAHRKRTGGAMREVVYLNSDAPKDAAKTKAKAKANADRAHAALDNAQNTLLGNLEYRVQAYMAQTHQVVEFLDENRDDLLHEATAPATQKMVADMYGAAIKRLREAQTAYLASLDTIGRRPPKYSGNTVLENITTIEGDFRVVH